jgi:valyl-tRNA synthetase
MGWRFGNKVWNAARFVMSHLGGERGDGTLASAVRLEDRWILSRLEGTRREVSAALDEYRLNDAANALYRFVWNDFCDWYLELVKPRLSADDDSAPAARGTLARVLADSLAMLHPFTPYITEVLWKSLQERLGRADAPLLMNASWPAGSGLALDAAAEADMGVIQDLVRAVRAVRALTMVGERKPLRATIAAPREHERRVLEQHAQSARALAFLESYELFERAARPPASAVAVAGGVEVFVQLGADVDLEKLRPVLRGRLDKLGQSIAQVDGKLANASFVARADPEAVAAERARRGELVLERELLERNLAGL